jgi:hypothetical protein
VAAGLEYGRRNPGATVAVLSCGANISSAALATALRDK